MAGGLSHTLDFSDLVDFGRRFPGLAVDRLEELMREAHRQLHARVAELTRELSPSGTSELSPSGTSDRPGHKHLRPSWRSVPANPESAIASLRPTRVEATAPHARVIDAGRQMAKAHQRRGKGGRKHFVRARMVGSEKAPLGVRGPVLLAIQAEEEEILRRAAQKVMGD